MAAKKKPAEGEEEEPIKWQESDFPNRKIQQQKERTKAQNDKVRRTPLSADRHAKLKQEEADIVHLSNSDWGKSVNQKQKSDYEAASKTWKSPVSKGTKPMADKPASTSTAKPAVSKPATPAKAPAAKKYRKLTNPAVVNKDEKGEYARRPSGERHYAEGGAFTPEQRAQHNYETSDERTSRMSAAKVERKKLVADRAANPKFSTTDKGEGATAVDWHDKPKKAAKTSVAKDTAKSIASGPVANPNRTKAPSGSASKPAAKSASASPSAPPRLTSKASDSSPIWGHNSMKHQESFTAPASGRSPEVTETKPHPATNKAQLSVTRPQAAVTKAQPAAHSKSFDSHADEAMSVGNSGKSSKSFSAHADEAVSMGNSGKSSKPAASTSRQPESRPASNPRPAAQSATVAPQKPESDSFAAPNVTFKPANKPKFERSAPASPSKSKSSGGSFAASKNVDQVVGLRAGRAGKKAVKAGRKLDTAERTHAGRSAYRQKTAAANADTREASKPQGPVARLLNGPKVKPANKMGPVEHVVRKAALGAGQKLDDRKLGKVAKKYDSAKSKAENVHDKRTGRGSLPKRTYPQPATSPSRNISKRQFATAGDD